MSLYKCPPKLNSDYRKIRAVPLHERLSRSTTQLQQWLSQVNHQIQTTKYNAATKKMLKFPYVHIVVPDRLPDLTLCAKTPLGEKPLFWNICYQVLPLLTTSFII